MQSVFQHWGTGIMSFLIAIFTAGSALTLTPFSWITVWQLIPIVTTGMVTWLIPLGTGKWPGVFKTGLDILGVAAVIILPYWVAGHWTPTNWIIVGLAILKAGATELGISIRTTSPALTTDSAAIATLYHQESLKKTA